MNKLLIYPMAFYVFYMWCLAVYMFRTRVATIKKGEVSHKYYKTFLGDPPPEKAMVVGRHFDNQFQVPVLFLIGCTIHLSLQTVNSLTLVLAWLFILSRLVHTWIHLGSNRLQRRVMAYAAGWIVTLLLWAQILIIL